MRFQVASLFALAVGHVSAAGPAVFYFTRFPTTSTAFRDGLIERMDNVSKWSCANEPGVKKYALVVPRDGDGKTAYSIEQYDDASTFQSHLNAKQVQDGLFSWTTSQRNIWTQDPSIANFTVLDGYNFVKPAFADVHDPFIVVETIQYKDGLVNGPLAAWQADARTAQTQQGTLGFGIYRDEDDANKLHVLGVYESLGYYVAAQSTRTAPAGSVEKLYLQKRGGFLYKGPEGCA